MAAAASRPTKRSTAPKSQPTSRTSCIYKDVFFHFAPIYLANHPVDKNFQVDDAVMAEFKKFLTGQNIDWTDADINGVSDWIKRQHQEGHRYHPVRPVAGPARHGRLGSR